MKIRNIERVHIIFEHNELPEAILLRDFYKSRGYRITSEFIKPPKDEQGYVFLESETVFAQNIPKNEGNRNS